MIFLSCLSSNLSRLRGQRAEVKVSWGRLIETLKVESGVFRQMKSEADVLVKLVKEV